MANKEQIDKALKERGMTRRSWARINHFNEDTTLSFIRTYTDKGKTPKGEIFKKIDETFKADFGFSIRNELEKIEHEND